MAKTSSANLIDPAAVSRLMRAQLQARLPMSGNMSGHHKSPHKGSSVEFAEYRKYVPGDDIRMLDWRVYARTDRFYMKEFEADTNLRGYFVLDASASMTFTSGEQSKFDYAKRMVATLAYLLVQQGDAVGLSCFAEEAIKEIPARRNPVHLRNIFDSMEAIKPQGKTALAAALHKLAERIPPRSLVMVFSDFFSDVEELLSCFQHLRFRKHDLALFHLLDRAEVDFDFSQPTRFVDLESPFVLLAEPEMIRRRYFDAMTAYLEKLKTGCSEYKTEYRRVVTDENYEKPIANFLIERARKKK